MKLRAWFERGAIIVAALATIATSRKGWVIQAKQLPDDPSKARIYVVEATHEPRLQMSYGGNHETPRPLDAGATWPGKGRYLIPVGAGVNGIVISDKCDGGNCKKCEAPSDARVQIESITPVTTWTLHATKSPDVQPTNMNPDTWTTFRVVVDASHPVRLTVTSTGPAGRVSQYGGEYHVDFGVVQQTTSFTWSVTATIEEACLEVTKPCAPPALGRVSIERIEREPSSGR